MASEDKFVTPLKVGIFVVVSFLAFASFLQIVSTRGYDRSGTYTVTAMFDDVLGLEKKSPVQIAGIDIGRIEQVELVGGRAKVTLRINGNVGLYEDARVEKVAVSLLGDYKLSVEPGGAAGKQKIGDGGVITNVNSISNTDAIIGEVREMTGALKKLIAGENGQPSPLEKIVADLQGTAASARVVLETVSKDIGDNTQTLNQILHNVDRFTSDLTQISGKDQDVASILADTRAIASSIRRTSESLEVLVAGKRDVEGEKDESVKSLEKSMDAMNRSLETLANILEKIDKGEGTVGSLINSKKVSDGIEEAVDGVNNVLGGFSRLQTWVNLRSEFQFRSGATKNYVQFTLMPKEDKYYIFEVVDDPRGISRTEIVDVETTSPELGRDFQYRERRTTTTDSLSFSLMFAKRFYWLALRFGIIEGTGGIGANVFLFKDRLEFLLDANKFGVEARNPRLKILALVEPIPHVYVHGGIDDFLNPGTTDFFIGAGVRFNDEDLKTLLIGVGIPSGGK